MERDSWDARPEPKKFLCRGKHRGTMCGRVLGINVIASGPDAAIICGRCGHSNKLPEVTKVPARV